MMKHSLNTNVNIIRQTPLIVQDNRACHCRNRPGNNANVKRVIQYRRREESLQTVVMPLSSIGGNAMFNNSLEILKKIDGVRGAGLIFQQTALRVCYDPDRTDPYTIQAALQTVA